MLQAACARLTPGTPPLLLLLLPPRGPPLLLPRWRRLPSQEGVLLPRRALRRLRPPQHQGEAPQPPLEVRPPLEAAQRSMEAVQSSSSIISSRTATCRLSSCASPSGCCLRWSGLWRRRFTTPAREGCTSRSTRGRRSPSSRPTGARARDRPHMRNCDTQCVMIDFLY